MAERAKSGKWIWSADALTSVFSQDTICVDGEWMDKTPSQLQADDGRQPRLADSEKITINLGFVDLGQIDLIVGDGFYSNRSDFIRTAIRNQLSNHGDVLKQSVSRNNFDLGLHDFSRDHLEALRESGRTLHIRVIGLARIAADVSPDLARSTIASVTVLGAIQASPAVKAALADRIS